MRSLQLSVLALLVFVLSACGGGGGGSSTRGMKITPMATAFFLEGNRVIVGVPSGAVTSDRVVTYSVPTNLPNDARYIPGTAIAFSESVFAKEVSLRLGYTPAALPAGTLQKDLVLARLSGSGWVEVPGSTVDQDGHAVNGFVTTFGTFGIIRKLAE